MNSSYRFTYKLLLFGFLFLIRQVGFAQEPILPQDTINQIQTDTLQQVSPTPTLEANTVVPIDTVSKASAPFGKKGRIGFYFDYLNAASALITDNKKLEGGISVLVFKNFLLSSELGTATLKPKSDLKNGNYTSEGNYWKAGLDYLINSNQEKDTRIFVGFRYAKSQFSDSGNYKVASTIWPDVYESSFKRKDLQADWYEILVGTEGKFWRNISAGWMLRYKTGIEVPNFSPVQVYRVPGFGPGTTKSAIGFNFYLKYWIKW